MNAPWWADVIVAAAMFLVGMGKGYSIAVFGHTLWRWVEVIGWIGLCGRFVAGLVLYGDVPVNSISLLFLLLICAGRLDNIRRQIEAERVKLFCFRDPAIRCNREDRIRAAILQRHEP
jgi:hypothetical protein